MTPPTEFLTHLIGNWELAGQMVETPLHQSVEAKWTLGGLFVEMYFRSTLVPPEGGKPYQALYLIGYDEMNKVYLLHLFDTLGVTRDYVLGIGKRKGNTIPFVFNYSTGPFTNLFIWGAQRGEWKMELTFSDNGAIKTFATKRMTRK